MATTVDVTTLEFTPEMAATCRHAGRNMPCPHGSGRKVKFCPCPVLHSTTAESVPWDVEKTIGEDMAVFMLAPRFNDVLPGAWEQFTDGDSWPGSMQALFTSKDQLTVARFVDWFLRAFPMPRYHDRTPTVLFAQDRADRIGPTGRRAAAAYAESAPALLEVTDYAAGERLRVKRPLHGSGVSRSSSRRNSSSKTSSAPAGRSTPSPTSSTARCASPPRASPYRHAGRRAVIAAVKEAVGAKPDTATIRATFPVLIKRAAEIEKEMEEAEKPAWTHASTPSRIGRRDHGPPRKTTISAVYESKEVLPRSASPFSWPVPEGEAGERFVAVGAGRVVLAASSPDLLATSRPALETKLGHRAIFVTETDEPVVLLLRRSWSPKTDVQPVTSEATVADASEPPAETSTEADKQ